MDAQQKAIEVVNGMLTNDPYSQWLGVELLEVKPDQVRIAMTVREEMLNGFGVCHGGITFAFADSALAFASNTSGRVTMSIDNSITYPVKILAGERLVAQARKLSGGGRISVYQVVVSKADDGQEAAHFKGTVYHTSKEHQFHP